MTPKELNKLNRYLDLCQDTRGDGKFLLAVEARIEELENELQPMLKFYNRLSEKQLAKKCLLDKELALAKEQKAILEEQVKAWRKSEFDYYERKLKDNHKKPPTVQTHIPTYVATFNKEAMRKLFGPDSGARRTPVNR